MSGYDLLKGLLVVEVASLGPAALGGFLADMGATVIKVEEPSGGDYVRYAGEHAVGSDDGLGYLFLRWNRGKRSAAIDLTSPQGQSLFRDFAGKADVVIEGMRAGALDRLDLGYEALKALNPALVYCSLSGLGRTGPYAAKGSHGPSFDAFGGLAQPPASGPVSKYDAPAAPAVGMYAMGLHAALGVLAAVIRARSTGQGTLVEVAAAESAAHWLPEALDPLLNADKTVPRAGFSNADGRMTHWPRMDNYRTRDGVVVLLQVFMEKFWRRFCQVVERPDLPEVYATAASPEAADAEIARRLGEIMAMRTYAEWTALFDAHDIPMIRVNSFQDVIQDPHFLARDNVYDVELPGHGSLRLTSTPVKVPGQSFSPSLAPTLGQHTDEVLSEVLGLSRDRVDGLRAAGVVR